jgi:hypothetical protein
MRDVTGELTKDGLSSRVRCRLQAFDYGCGQLRWAGWVNPAEGHPLWHPIVIQDHRPFTFVTDDGQELEIVLHNTAGYFQGVRGHTSNRYPTERHFVDAHTFVEIEFYKDGDAVRVWPYIGEKFPNCERRDHFVVPGTFGTQDDARTEALRVAQLNLSTEWRSN